MDLLKLDEIERALILAMVAEGADPRYAIGFIVNFGCEC